MITEEYIKARIARLQFQKKYKSSTGLHNAKIEELKYLLKQIKKASKNEKI